MTVTTPVPDVSDIKRHVRATVEGRPQEAPLALAQDAPEPKRGSQGTAATLPRTSWTAAELMATEFPEPRWAVPDIVSEGVTLLAGAPKVGKSWLILGIALAVASGGKALGKIDVEPGPVLYLALEDTGRRLKSRLGKLLGRSPAPDMLQLATACPSLPDGGVDQIDAWLTTHPDARLVVIDVLARMRGTTPPGTSAYDADYQVVGAIKALADKHGVAVVLVHHVRKAGAEDFLNEVSGTNGLAGAADAIAVLKRSRGTADAVLHLTGRDVDEAEHALKFEPDLGLWKLLDGPAEEHAMQATRQALLRHVRDNPGVRPKQVADVLDLPYATVKKTLARMADDGQLDTDGNGRYLPPSG